MSAPNPPRPDPDSDDVLARLRDADPAGDVEPDLVRLRSAVDARLAAEATDTTPAPATQARTDELAARRARRRLPMVAAVAAAAVIVGSAGYGLGRLGPQPPADTVITLPAGATAEGGGGGAEPAPLGAAADARLSIFPPGGGWRTVFSASGLSDAAGSGQAWVFDAASVFSKESAEAAARALGLEGEAASDFGAWVVGSRDGTGPTLSLQPDGWASLSFYDPTRDPYSCLRAEDAAAGAGGVRCATDDPGPAPSGPEAAARLRALLADLGIEATIEVETTVYDVTEEGSARMTTATGHGVLDGQRTGVTWSVTLLGNGVQSFYGPLAPLAELGTYDVVSENEAVRRLNDPRFGGSGGFIPLAAARESAASDAGAAVAPADVATDVVTEPDVTSSDIQAETPTVPPAVDPGSAIPWPVTEVTITGARLGSAVQWLPDGQVVILPAYELTDDDGGTWSVLAVADSRLDFSTD